MHRFKRCLVSLFSHSSNSADALRSVLRPSRRVNLQQDSVRSAVRVECSHPPLWVSVTFVTSSTALSGVPALSCAVPPAIWLSITLTSFTVKGPNPSGAGQADSSAFFCVHLHRSRRSASSTGAAAWVTFSTTCPPSNRVPVNSVEQCQCSSVQPAWQQDGG